MKLALAQLDIKRGEPEYNLGLIRRFAEDAASSSVDLLCLPEMVTTGFDWSKNRELLPDVSKQHEEVAEIARMNNIAICGSFLDAAPSGKPYNTFIYFDASGSVLAKYNKIHLFTLFKEEQHVEAGDELVVADIHHCKAGFAVCYDLRFPDIFRRNTELGAKIQILPAAFPHPRLEHWRTLVRARAIENQCYFIAVNQSGSEGHGSTVGTTQYFGHSMVVDPWGEIVVEGGEAEELLTADLDLSLVDQTREKLPSFRDRRPELY